MTFGRSGKKDSLDFFIKNEKSVYEFWDDFLDFIIHPLQETVRERWEDVTHDALFQLSVSHYIEVSWHSRSNECPSSSWSSHRTE